MFYRRNLNLINKNLNKNEVKYENIEDEEIVFEDETEENIDGGDVDKKKTEKISGDIGGSINSSINQAKIPLLSHKQKLQILTPNLEDEEEEDPNSFRNKMKSAEIAEKMKEIKNFKSFYKDKSLFEVDEEKYEKDLKFSKNAMSEIFDLMMGEKGLDVMESDGSSFGNEDRDIVGEGGDRGVCEWKCFEDVEKESEELFKSNVSNFDEMIENIEGKLLIKKENIQNMEKDIVDTREKMNSKLESKENLIKEINCLIEIYEECKKRIK